MAPELDQAERPTRILIVDDHEVSRAALGALLRTEGFAVIDVPASDEAITVAIAFRPCVAIIDVAPGCPAGLGVASRLRDLPQAPAVVLTSSTDRSRFGTELGSYPFLAKADVCGQAITGLLPGSWSSPASRSFCGGGQLAAEVADLGRVGDDVNGLDPLSSHAQHQQCGEGTAVEAEEGGLPADGVRDQRGARSPEPQQVRGDISGPGDNGERLGGWPEIDVAPRIRGENRQ